MIRQIATLLSGNALSQAVNVATILFVVTPYFDPAEFGRYAVVMAYVGILSSIACLRYELSVVSVARTRVANNMVFSSLGIATAMSILVLIAFGLAETCFGNAFLLGISPAIVVALIYLKAIDQVCASVLYRYESYLTYSSLKLMQALVLFAGFLSAGLLGWGLYGLLYSTLFAYLAFGLAGVVAIRRFDVYEGVRPGRMAAMLKKYSDFLKFNTPQALIDNFLTNGLNLVLVALAGPAVVGYFSYLQKTLKAPLGLIFGAVSQVVFRFCAKNKLHPERVSRKLRQTLIINIAILMTAFAAISIVYAFFQEFAFLEEWSGLQHYMMAFATWMMAPFLFSPFATLPVVYDLQKTFFKLATTFNLLSLLLLAFIIWKGTVVMAFWVVGLASLVYFSGLNAWVFGIAGRAHQT
jgi:O-antigen/teichoic acid export membrane protein